MDDHKLSDESIDQIVRSTLAAQPAMDFVARVRTDIAAHNQSPKFSRAWLALGVVSVAAVFVIGTVIRSSAPAPVKAPLIAKAAPPAPLDTEPTTPAPDLTGRVGKVLAVRPAARATTHAPEVLVPPDQAIAVRELVRNLDRYELSFEDTHESVFTEIQMTPLSIDPLVIDNTNEGAIQ